MPQIMRDLVHKKQESSQNKNDVEVQPALL